ncbi:putative feruloyl esterase [Fusarium oxysporum f. sp. narcissi]|uniref:Carboxylic ester hydrolase n=1 Tax=Fusarium oxysporum f. sp. narcissi TaxID=451672 RepID=A0A4Q2VAB4_FUSOX|nr:putative feruloyl esterase [Fusarium oxysporum f. sp. narcissi]
MLLPILITTLLWHSTAVSADTDEVVACQPVKLPPLDGLEVVSVTAIERRDHTVPKFKMPYVLDHDIPNLNFCNITVKITHPELGDLTTISVWLPSRKDWNGRFMATGGGGWASGTFDPSLGQAIEQGFAAASTDGGHAIAGSNSDIDPTPWALKEDGSINWQLLHSFAGRSAHNMGVVGKAVTEAHYGVKPHHSYWSGCSNGGRQGLVVAQQYPEDYDGILAAAPALNFPALQMASLWPQIVMKEAGSFPPPCELDYFAELALEQCDGLDGLVDGVIQSIDDCDFDPFQAVGRTIQCNDESIVISNSTAALVARMTAGPTSPQGQNLWFGIPPSCRLSPLAGTKVSPVTGQRVGAPFFVSDAWVKAFLRRDLSYDVTQIGAEEYTWLFTQSLLQYDWLLGSNNPDLSGLRKTGTKLLSWHGMLDELIPYKTIIQYRQRVEEMSGGASATNEFFRLFLAPGVKHCAFGDGPVPVKPINALIAWVEEGVPAQTLVAETKSSGSLVRRNLCLYPQQLHYVKGDPASPESWTCVDKKDAKSKNVQVEKGFGSSIQKILGKI